MELIIKDVNDENDRKAMEHYIYGVDPDVIIEEALPSSIEQVKEFHRLFQPETITEEILHITPEVTALRLKLIFEELHELACAMGAGNIFSRFVHLSLSGMQNKAVREQKDVYNTKEILDALCDLRYVVDGTAVVTGLDKVYELGIREVHRSNMSKACNTHEEALATKKKYEDEWKEFTFYIHPVGDKFVVYRNDRKVMKSINYSPANLSKFVE